MTEDETGWMASPVGWLNEHEFEQTPGDGEGQGSLACYNPGAHKVSDTTEQLNNSCLNYSKLQLSSTHLVFVTCFPSHSSHCSSIVQPQTPSPRVPFKTESSVLLTLIIFYTCACSIVQLCLTLCDPMDCRPPGSMGFSRQEYCSGLPFPSPGDLPDPGIQPESPAL